MRVVVVTPPVPVVTWEEAEQHLRLDGDVEQKPMVERLIAAATAGVKLRDNVTFSDGTPFTSADVVFSFRALYDPKVSSPIATGMLINDKPIQAPDGHTVASMKAVLASSAPCWIADCTAYGAVQVKSGSGSTPSWASTSRPSATFQ